MLTLFRPFEALTRRPWAKELWATDWADDMAEAWKPRAAMPRFDVVEEEARFVVTAEIPGMTPEEVTVKLEHNALVVQAKHEEKKEEEGRRYHRIGTFRRQFQLPPNVAADAIEATMADGLLTVFLPKTEPTKAKEIPIGA